MKNDKNFSEHKDYLLRNLWQYLSVDGRYVITTSTLMQRQLGIDVVLQGKNKIDRYVDIKIDSKHVHGIYENFYLEELSCSLPGHEKPGWLMKEDGWPDLILYCFWPECKKLCPKKGTESRGENCWECGKNIFPATAYLLDYQPLRNWFLDNHKKYEWHVNEYEPNQTTGRKVPIKALTQEQGIVLNKFTYDPVQQKMLLYFRQKKEELISCYLQDISKISLYGNEAVLEIKHNNEWIKYRLEQQKEKLEAAFHKFYNKNISIKFKE